MPFKVSGDTIFTVIFSAFLGVVGTIVTPIIIDSLYSPNLTATIFHVPFNLPFAIDQQVRKHDDTLASILKFYYEKKYFSEPNYRKLKDSLFPFYFPGERVY